MTATRSRPMFPRFDYLTTRPVDQLDQTAARCKLPAACCLRGWIAIGLRCRKSRPVAGRESAFAFAGMNRCRLSPRGGCQLRAACCQLSAGLDRYRLSLLEIVASGQARVGVPVGSVAPRFAVMGNACGDLVRW